MNRLIIICIIMMFSLSYLTACTGGSPKDIFETAKFEELQNNREHAVELYETIVKEYPDSEYAKKAAERLSELKKK